MAIEITTEQRDKILGLPEDYFYELKSKQIAPAKLSEVISSFANSAGGEIYVGITEKKIKGNKRRTWDGFEDEEAANAIFQVINQIAPLADFIDTTMLKHKASRGEVLKIEIRKNATIARATNEKPYIRKGAQKLPVDTEEGLDRLRLDKGVASYEDYTVQAELSEVENSETILDFLINVIPTAEPLPWLEKQRLVKEGNPTVAGVLLFSEEPQAILPKRSAVKIFRYTTSDKVPTRDQLAFEPITVEGPAYKLIYEAVQTTQNIIEDIGKLDKKGLREVKYPPETLHEIITNAVLHRDYSIASDVQIRIFDNRVEVESPGRLAGHVTTDNILDTQYARNQRIVRLINKFPNPPNKDVGEGLNTAFDAMRNLRLKDPEITETGNSVNIVIPHQPLSSPEDLVMEYLEGHEEIANRVARQLCGIASENTMKGLFKRLEARGMIEQVPNRSRSKAAWRKRVGES